MGRVKKNTEKKRNFSCNLVESEFDDYEAMAKAKSITKTDFFRIIMRVLRTHPKLLRKVFAEAL